MRLTPAHCAVYIVRVEQIGRYILVQRVGRGGMAEVFRALQQGPLGFGRQVAVKRILEHLCMFPEFVDMFTDEARIAAGLQHPNIVPVLDLGVEDGTHYMVLDYVPGASLKDVAEAAQASGERMTPALCFHVVHQFLLGLQAAHTRVDAAGRSLGIIHRDVSPQNVMLAFDGRVLLADFGVARARDRLVRTHSGGVKGKFGYMAPEQGAGEAYDHRVDLYAAGVVLHEILSGRPFRDVSLGLGVMPAVLEGTYTPLTALGVTLPPDAQAVVDRAVSPKAATRFEDATTMLAAMEAVMAAQAWHTTPQDLSRLLARWMPERLAKEKQAEAYVATLAASQNRQATPAGVSSGARARRLEGEDPQRMSFPLEPLRHDLDVTQLDVEGLTAPGELPSATPARLQATLRASSPVAAPEVSSDTVRQPRARRRLVWLWLAGALVLVALAGWWLTRTPPIVEAVPVAPPSVPEVPQPSVEPAPPTPEPAGPDLPATPAVATKGWLNVQAFPWCRVLVDGKDTGRFTPLARLPLAVGKHTVELVNDAEKIHWRGTVNIRPGATTELSRQF